jgi:hypothetical protein
LNFTRDDITAKVSLDGGIADKAIRLREIGQQAHRPMTNPAAKPANGDLRGPTVTVGQPAFIIPERRQRSSHPAVGTTKRSRHAGLLLRGTIFLLRPFYSDDDLHSNTQSCRNHA